MPSPENPTSFMGGSVNGKTILLFGIIMMIIFVQTNNQSSAKNILSAAPFPPTEQQVKKHLTMSGIGTWYYPSRFDEPYSKNTIKQLKAIGIRSIYFPINEKTSSSKDWQKITEFVNYAHKKGMKVYGISFIYPTIPYIGGYEEKWRTIIRTTKHIFDGYTADTEIYIAYKHINKNTGKNYPRLDATKDLEGTRYLIDGYIKYTNALRRIADEEGVLYGEFIHFNMHKHMLLAGYDGGISLIRSHFVMIHTYLSKAENIVEVLEPQIDAPIPKIVDINIVPNLIDPCLNNTEFRKWMKIYPSYKAKHKNLMGIKIFRADALLNQNKNVRIIPSRNILRSR